MASSSLHVFEQSQFVQSPFAIPGCFQVKIVIERRQKFQFNSSIPFCAGIKHWGSLDTSLNYYLTFSGNKYYQLVVVPLKVAPAAESPQISKFQLVPRQPPQFDEFDPRIQFECFQVGTHKKLIWSSQFFLSIDLFLGGFYPPAGRSADSQVCNILLLGPAGSGKSCFVNAAYSLLSGRAFSSISLTGGATTTQTTQQVCSYRLGDITNREKLGIRLWDTPGLCPLSFLPYFWLGAIKPRTDYQFSSFRNPSTAIDCVICFITSEWIACNFSSYLDTIRLQAIPIVLVSQNDDTEYCGAPVYPLLTYRSSLKSDFFIDKAIFQILFKAGLEGMKTRARRR